MENTITLKPNLIKMSKDGRIIIKSYRNEGVDVIGFKYKKHRLPRKLKKKYRSQGNEIAIKMAYAVFKGLYCGGIDPYID